jgi:WD40 repeat protein
VLDQFEELLDERLSTPAVDALADVLFGESVPTTVRVLATLRADFLEAALAHPRLAPVVRKDNTYNLTPMSPGQLHESIAKPVEAIPGVSYEPRLAERILADAGTEPGALPLLGFTLDQLWHKQSGGVLTLRAYEELGGVTGALQAYAQKTWSNNVEAKDEAAGGQLLTQLVRVPIGVTAATRRITSRTELREGEWRIAQNLAGTRLLTINRNDDGTETVELAHEALITAWDKLAALVASDREYLVWRESLRHDMSRWNDAERSPELLPTTVALKAAQRWLDERATALSESEHGYLERGRAYRRSRTRRRRTLLALVCVLALTAATVSAVSVRLNQDTARAAAVTRANNLAADAAALESTDPGLAGQLAIAAYRTSPTQTAVSQLYTTLSTPLDHVVENTGNAVLRTVTQADGPLAAVIDDDGSLRIWNTADPATPVLDATIHAQASAIALAPRSGLLAAACPVVKALCLWSLADPRHPLAISRLPFPAPRPGTSKTGISSMAISPDGTLLAAAALNGRTAIWSIAQPRRPRLLAIVPNPARGALHDLAAVAFAPRGSLLATTIQDGETELWNLADPARPSPAATISTGYQAVAFSPDGSLLAAAGDTNTGLWNLQNPAHPASIDINHDCSPSTSGTLDFSTTAFSPDGKRLAFSGTDTDDSHGELCTLSLSAGNLHPAFSGSPTVTGTLTGFGTMSMAYTTSGALLTGGNDGTVRLWRRPLPEAEGTRPTGDSSWALSPSGHLLAAPITSSQTAPPLGIWDLAAPDGPALDATVPLPAQLQSVSFLNETALLTVDHNGAVQLWNLRAPRHPAKAASLGTANFTLNGGFIAYPGVSSNTAGTLVSVQRSDNKLHLWRIDTVHATEIGSIPATDTTANLAGIPGNGNTVIVATKTGINWWDTADPAHAILTGTSPLTGASQGSFTSGGNTLAATTSEAGTSGDVSLELFGIAGGRAQSTVTLSRSTGSTLAISNDGHLLAATGTAGNTITLWDTSDPGHPRNLATVLPGKDVTDVTNIAFDPSSRLMADWSSASRTGIVQLWDISNPSAPVLEYSLTNPDGTLSTAGFTPSGTAFAVASDNSVFLYDTDPAKLATQLCSYTGNSITPAQWQQDAPGIPYQNPCP